MHVSVGIAAAVVLVVVVVVYIIIVAGVGVAVELARKVLSRSIWCHIFDVRARSRRRSPESLW
jgi:hypothetical protein